MKRIFFLAILFLGSACQNGQVGKTEIGALGGAAAGAGLGAIIGHETGNTGAGIAIGSAFGALGGGLLGSEMDETDRTLQERDERIRRQERELEENRRLIQDLKARGVDVHSSSRGVVVNLPDVLFEFDSARLTGDAQGTVGEIGNVLEEARGRRISVEGHTDSVGTVNYNYRLSEDRARGVARELEKNGVPARSLMVRGFGESSPIASNKTETGRGRNRRVEVIIENAQP